MATSPRSREGARGGFHLAVTLVALLVTVYLAFQLIGFLFKLVFLGAAALIGFAAWRAWRRAP
jgi:hypothetical protein